MIKVVAFAEGGWDMPDSFPFTMAFTALFEKGVVEYNNRQEKPLTIYELGGKVKHPEVQLKLEEAEVGPGNIAQLGGYFSEIKYFLDYLEKGEPPTIATANQARDSLKVVLTEMKSAQRKEIIKLV